MVRIAFWRIIIPVISVYLCQPLSAAYDNLALVEKALNNRRLHDDTSANIYTKGNDNDVLAGWFISNEEIDKLVTLLVAEFKGETTMLGKRDKSLIKILKNDLDGYYVWEPRLEFKHSYKGLTGVWLENPVYKITGWNKIKFDPKNNESMRKFIKLFLAGAHFVVVGSNKLILEIKSLPASAKNLKHSHYNETPNALVYPAITWVSRSPAPIIPALLIDLVKLADGSNAGTFFQLEGWPVHAKSDTANDKILHGKDFLTHSKTLWNISTYGMSPYSEKRGTTVFLAKKDISEETLNKLAKETFKSDYTKYAEDMRQ